MIKASNCLISGSFEFVVYFLISNVIHFVISKCSKVHFTLFDP